METLAFLFFSLKTRQRLLYLKSELKTCTGMNSHILFLLVATRGRLDEFICPAYIFALLFFGNKHVHGFIYILLYLEKVYIRYYQIDNKCISNKEKEERANSKSNGACI